MCSNVSAEIFVVCRDFLAPKHIDPKFLDPRHVFKDLSASVAGAPEKGLSAGNAQANVFQPEKKRRHRDGYAEGDYTLHSKTGVSDFIKGADPIAVLGAVSQLTFDTDEEKGSVTLIYLVHNKLLICNCSWLDLDVTTGDVKANCDDLKVLGRGDFKSLLKWRTALREEVCEYHIHSKQLIKHLYQIGLEVKVKGTDELTEQVEVTEDLDEDEQIQNEVCADEI
jgi:AdoMet-dependent rRNA methyltransferase SPB1